MWVMALDGLLHCLAASLTLTIFRTTTARIDKLYRELNPETPKPQNPEPGPQNPKP